MMWHGGCRIYRYVMWRKLYFGKELNDVGFDDV